MTVWHDSAVWMDTYPGDKAGGETRGPQQTTNERCVVLDSALDAYNNEQPLNYVENKKRRISKVETPPLFFGLSDFLSSLSLFSSLPG